MRRPVFISGARRDTAVYRAAGLVAEIQGPAIIEDEYTTIYVAEGWRCAPGERGALVAAREARKESGS
jgi:N-methylhydantoinase A